MPELMKIVLFFPVDLVYLNGFARETIVCYFPQIFDAPFCEQVLIWSAIASTLSGSDGTLDKAQI